MSIPDVEVDEVAREAGGAARSSPRAHEIAVELEVPLYHIDALGIVWHGRYYEYWLRDTKHRLHVEYEIANLTQGQRAARAHTILVTTDPTGRLLLRTPEAILERLAQDESPQP